MKTRFRSSTSLPLSLMGVVIWSGCNSSSPPSDTKAPTSAPVASSPSTTTADDTAAPQRKPPAGMGNAIGRVLFDGKGAPGIEVQLCEKLGLIGGCDGRTYQGKTNMDGFYVIDKVQPGEYAVAVRVFDTNKFIYPTSGMISAAKFKVEKNESLTVRAVNLWKTNLQITSPKRGASVKMGKPNFSWKAYPNADKYKVTLRTKGGIGVMTTMETGEPQVAPEKPLLNGEYQWEVEAFNAEGTKIAETSEDATFKVSGQSGSNTVELVNPKLNASVSGNGLTLQWKAHLQASEYRVYLKGVKAKDPLLRFETVSGTSYKFSAPLPPDDYFWSVEARQGDEKLAGSELQRFTVK